MPVGVPLMSTAVSVALFVLLLVVGLAAALALLTLRTVRRVEAALPPAGRFVDVPGALLHVVERGHGPALLLVHGLGGQLGNFTYALVDELADDFHVVAVDRPGSGYSARAPTASASLSAQADALAALIETLALDRAIVVGHSLGGTIALALAQRHPERVAALALVAPLIHPSDVPAALRGLRIVQPRLCQLIAWTLAIPILIAKREDLLALVFRPEAVPRDYAMRGGGLLALRPSHFVAACADLGAIPQSLPAIVQGCGAMRLPVSILYGRSDNVLSPLRQGETLRSLLPGAQLALIEGGHMLPVTAPTRTAQFIREVAARTRI